MNSPTVLIPVAAGVALAGCTGIPVRTDQNSQLLATVHCQSVAWAGGFKGASPLRNTIANPLNEARLRDAIAANLQTAGIALVAAPAAAAGAAAPAACACPVPDRLWHRHGARRGCRVPRWLGLWSGILGPTGPRLGLGRGGGWGWGWGWGEPYVYARASSRWICMTPPRACRIWHASAEQSLSGLTRRCRGATHPRSGQRHLPEVSKIGLSASRPA